MDESYYTTVLFFTPNKNTPSRIRTIRAQRRRRRVRSISAEKRGMADAAK
jgi:hypothetical protein